MPKMSRFIAWLERCPTGAIFAARDAAYERRRAGERDAAWFIRRMNRELLERASRSRERAA